jgi:hypothetical protein
LCTLFTSQKESCLHAQAESVGVLNL